MRRTLLFLAALGTGLGLASAARAEFQLCNKTGSGASVAVGYLDAAKGWTAQGWANIASGQCSNVIAGPLGGSYVYVLIYGQALPPAPGQKGGWFCTHNRGFVTRNNDYADATGGLLCEAAGLRLEQFRQIPIKGASASLNLK